MLERVKLSESIDPKILREMMYQIDILMNPTEQFCGMGDVKFIRPGDTRSIRSGHVGPCVIMTCRLADGTVGMAHLNRQDYSEGWWKESIENKAVKMGYKGVAWRYAGENEKYFVNRSSSVEFTLDPDGDCQKET